MAELKQIELKGRVFITFDIKAVTGLHIGGWDTGIEIGGVDKTVIRDALTNRPYIAGEEDDDKARLAYQACDVCQVFGVPGERKFATPTRLIVRDVHLSQDSAQELEQSARTDLPYTEVKTEVSIDRVTSAANPRQMERVPAGSVFDGAELVYSVYEGADCDARADVDRLNTVLEGLQLLEDDYLGGLGSRGSGKVRLTRIRLAVRPHDRYLDEPQQIGGCYDDLSQLLQAQTRTQAIDQIKEALQL
jgi:CRISPR-associated protein Csm3